MRKMYQTFGDSGAVTTIPVCLTWQDVCYSVKVKENGAKVDKELLRHISGSVEPGQFLAIIGSSGAGKSTLLDVLANRKSTGKLSGQVLVNGERPNSLYRRLHAYVTQEDVLMGTCTVWETMMFYAKLKLPSSMSNRQKVEKAEELVQRLGLSDVRNSYVGTSAVRGISGGEKKRLSIACQLLTDPMLLLLDEPTTGLDSYNSQSVVRLLSELARRDQRAVVATIHQASSSMFEDFDQLLVLDAGRVIYFGPAKQALTYFSSLGRRCPPRHNPADFFIDMVTNDAMAARKALKDAEGAGSRKSLGAPTLADAYDVSEMRQAAENRASELLRAVATNTALPTNTAATSVSFPRPSTLQFSEYSVSWLTQFLLLSKRALLNIWRQPRTSYGALIQTIFMACLLGSIYWRMGLTEGSIQDRMGALFFVLTNMSFSQMPSLMLFLEERELYHRERAAGCYRPISYFLSKTFAEGPVFVIFPIVFGVIMYWMVGLQSGAEQFARFLLILVLLCMTASSLFAAFGAAVPLPQLAQVLSSVALVLFMLFGGFFLSLNSIPVYYVWIKWISFFKYSFEALVANEFRGLVFTCDASQAVNGICPIPTGEAQLKILGMEDVNVWLDVAALAAMVVVYRFLGYLALRFLNKEKR